MTHAAVLGSIFAVHVLAMISPGPNVLVVTQTAMSRTRRAGIFAALGIAAGAATWSIAALLGLSVLFAHLPWLLGGLKLVGGVYLLYLGITLWRTADRRLAPPGARRAAADTDWRAFRLGLLTNVTNPKAAIFYGSILAAFLTPDLPAWVQLTALGIIVANAIGWHVTLACLFSTRRARQAYERTKPWIDRVAGSALGVLGLRLILSTR